MQKATSYIKFFSIIFLLLISSCLSRFEDHGYIFESIKKEDLSVDLSSKNEVLELWGPRR